MAWDPVLLRKYSSTNHYKLLNQVRGDLKEQPIQRSGTQTTRRSGSGRRRAAAASPRPMPVSVEPAAVATDEVFLPIPILIEPFE